jgi:predicted DNA-binding transcriptional regulator AlpA
MTNDANTPDHAVDEREAATVLGFSTSWLRQQRMRGTGPAYVRVGRSVRYLTRDLDRFQNSHRIETRSYAR